MFKIIVNCGPRGLNIKCVESLLLQGVKDWKAFVTLDGSPSLSEIFTRSEVFTVAREPRFHVRTNTERMYSLCNQVRSITDSGTDPSDVIVTLDGDDWFSRPDALQIILDVYKDTNCWMTYGSWVSTKPR